MPAQTDRDKIKKQQMGEFRTSAGITDSKGTVEKLHEETFVIIKPAGAPLAETAITMVKACRVKSVRSVPGATLATHASNYVTGTVAKRDGAGGNATTIGVAYTTNSTGGAALTAFVPTVGAVSSTAGVADLAAGQILTFAEVDAGTTTEVQVTVSITVEYI